ncbi:MAG TPA: glycosyltransferase family 2 protein [Pseudobdellovibrionaceae bacterium]
MLANNENPSSDAPLIGIAMATYNPSLSYFLGQISSLKNQTFKNWKCVVVDDNSNDKSYQIILDVIADDPRFQIHRNSSNQGSFKTFERALSLLPEEVQFVCYCDQDDIWIPTKLEIQLRAFKDPSVFLVHTDQSLIDEKNRVFVNSCWELEGRNVLEASTDLLLFRNLITGCTTMFRKEVLKTALPFYPLRPHAEMYHHDMWIAMHACVYGKVLGLKEPLVLYRQHGGNLVGVSSLRRNVKLWELASRARRAFNERRGLREDFLRSLRCFENGAGRDQERKLSYLDNPLALLFRGFGFVLGHPLFFRTWVMLGVGLFSVRLKKEETLNTKRAS